jgi:hypothetical protein
MQNGLELDPRALLAVTPMPPNDTMNGNARVVPDSFAIGAALPQEAF